MTMTTMLVILLVLALLATSALAGGGHDEIEDKGRMVLILVSVLLSLFPEEFGFKSPCETTRPSVYPIKRSRRPVSDIMRELGPVYTKRAYRMTGESFFNLHKILWKYLRRPVISAKKKCRNGSPNGIVPTTVWLSIAMRYFAGGRSEDIAIVHGVSHTEVFRSVFGELWTWSWLARSLLLNFHRIMQSKRRSLLDSSGEANPGLIVLLLQ
jgi:hypothetical protein